jgi:hypothetical protein
MAMLSWTKLNPTVKQISTKKKFFGKYLFKVNVWCPAARIIVDQSGNNVDELLEQRINAMDWRYRNYGGSWDAARNAQIKQHADVKQLQNFIDIKHQFKDQIKIRVEEPHISVYSNDEAFLYSLVSKVLPDRILEVHAPSSKAAEDALNDGNVITKRISDYSYKVVLKERMLADSSLKENVKDYLYNLNEEVKMTNSLIKNLSSKYSYFLGGYFYCKDINITTFLTLMCPDLISGIYKLTTVE